jgi:hypothetical protein
VIRLVIWLLNKEIKFYHSEYNASTTQHLVNTNSVLVSDHKWLYFFNFFKEREIEILILKLKSLFYSCSLAAHLIKIYLINFK